MIGFLLLVFSYIIKIDSSQSQGITIKKHLKFKTCCYDRNSKQVVNCLFQFKQKQQTIKYLFSSKIQTKFVQTLKEKSLILV